MAAAAAAASPFSACRRPIDLLGGAVVLVEIENRMPRARDGIGQRRQVKTLDMHCVEAGFDETAAQHLSSGFGIVRA